MAKGDRGSRGRDEGSGEDEQRRLMTSMKRSIGKRFGTELDGEQGWRIGIWERGWNP